jgi:O-antigen/teichoic acid export membrane protein
MEEHEKKKIVKNLKWMTFSKIIIYLLSIITITLIPRYLGVEGYGQLNFIISFVSIFSIIGDLGLSTLIVRDLSKNTKKAKEYYNNLFLFKMFITVLFLIVVTVFAFILHNSPTTDLIIVYAVAVGLSTISNFNISFLNAFQEIKYRAISDIIFKLMYTIGVIFVIFLNYKLFGIVIASVISCLITMTFTFFIIKKYKLFAYLKINKKYIKQKVIQAFPFVLTSIFWMIYFSIDKIFITYFKGNYLTGLYSISYTFIGFLIGSLTILYETFLPVLSSFSKNKEKLQQIVSKYIYLVYLLCVPATIGGIYLAPQIISLVFGEQYLGGTLTFQLIMFFFLLNSVGRINYQILITNHLEKYSLKILGISALVNTLLNFIFVPWLGIVGAAITTIISEIIIFILSYKKIKHIIKVPYFKQILLPVLASILMLFGLIIYNKVYPLGILNSHFDVLIPIAIGCIIYISALMLTKAITIKQIKELLKNE